MEELHLLQKTIESFSRPPINHDIKQWLQHRQEMWVQYTQLCSIHAPQLETVAVFCQLLMDYISFGHFKMFERLAESSEFHQPNSQGLDKNLLNQISLTTDIALNFNDKYTEPKCLETLSLSTDLSYLGENLASRMAWEDKLIKAFSQFYS